MVRHLQVFERSGSPRGGFSLIELLVVLVLVVVAYAFYLGAGSKTVQDGKKEACARQLEQLFMAMKAYAGDHDGLFPRCDGVAEPSEPLSLLVPQYTSDTSLFICPGSRLDALPAGRPFSGRKISYAYYMGYRLPADPGDPEAWPLLSDSQVDAMAKKKGQPVFATVDRAPGNNHREYGGNILFTDGHCERAEPAAGRDLPVGQGVVLLNPH